MSETTRQNDVRLNLPQLDRSELYPPPALAVIFTALSYLAFEDRPNSDEVLF